MPQPTYETVKICIMRSSDDPTAYQQSRPTWNEAERLAALRQYGILDTPREIEFDDVVRIACHVCAAPVAPCYLD
jgi:hypothetical protein